MSRLGLSLLALAGLFALPPLVAPRLLAFPYSAQIGKHHVFSEAPLNGLQPILQKADARVASSALGGSRPLNQDIYLTHGGWRWSWLALASRSAFAISKPLTENIIANRSNIVRDLVENGQAVAGRRPLDGTLAHEMTHGAIRAHFGLYADWRYSAELREGYCDYVAGSGSLNNRQAQALEAENRKVPALQYWRGRKAITAALAANGGSVDSLFAKF